jgi:hypothetical protein
VGLTAIYVGAWLWAARGIAKSPTPQLRRRAAWTAAAVATAVLPRLALSLRSLGWDSAASAMLGLAGFEKQMLHFGLQLAVIVVALLAGLAVAWKGRQRDEDTVRIVGRESGSSGYWSGSKRFAPSSLSGSSSGSAR